MKYIITEEQHNIINSEMPTGFEFSYVDELSQYVHDDYWVDYWKFDIDNIIQNSLDMSYQDLKDMSLVEEYNDTILNYKIGKYVDSFYYDHPFNLIDFTNMLKRKFSTTKDVTWLKNGRPEKADYYILGEHVARIYFTFVATSDNTLVSRKEELVYYKLEGEESSRINIFEKTYNPANLSITDGALVMQEREIARKNIISGMKVFLGGVLGVALQSDLATVTKIIKPFWDEFLIERQDFIDLGVRDWSDKVSAIDLQTTPYYWLAFEISPGITVRDHIVDTLVYSATYPVL